MKVIALGHALDGDTSMNLNDTQPPTAQQTRILNDFAENDEEMRDRIKEPEGKENTRLNGRCSEMGLFPANFTMLVALMRTTPRRGKFWRRSLVSGKTLQPLMKGATH